MVCPKILKKRRAYRASIIDDLLNEVFSRAVGDLFTKGSHRRNLSVIVITQLFSQSGPL